MFHGYSTSELQADKKAAEEDHEKTVSALPDLQGGKGVVHQSAETFVREGDRFDVTEA